MSVDCALSDAIGRVLQGKRVKDLGLDIDVSDSRIKVAFAGSERGFAFCTGQDGDEVRFLAVIARDFGNGAGVWVSLHVGLASAVVDNLTWWFTSDPESAGVVGRGKGSPKCIEIALALCWLCRGRGERWCRRFRSGRRGDLWCFGRSFGFPGGKTWAAWWVAVRWVVRWGLVTTILLSAGWCGVVGEWVGSPWCRFLQGESA